MSSNSGMTSGRLYGHIRTLDAQKFRPLSRRTCMDSRFLALKQVENIPLTASSRSSRMFTFLILNRKGMLSDIRKTYHIQYFPTGEGGRGSPESCLLHF